MVDIHNHILFGVDEGALNLKQSKNMLKKMYDEGVRTIIATPNYGVGCVNPSKDELLYKLELLRIEAENIDPSYSIYLGNELYFSDDSLEDLRKKKISTMAGSRYVLVSYPNWIDYRELKNGLHRLLIQGYYPILCQMDKYEQLMYDYNKVKELIELGVYMEIDSNALFFNRFHKTNIFIKKLISMGMIHFVSSNAKNDIEVSYKIMDAYNYVMRKFGEECSRRIFYENGHKIVKNIYI